MCFINEHNDSANLWLLQAGRAGLPSRIYSGICLSATYNAVFLFVNLLDYVVICAQHV